MKNCIQGINVRCQKCGKLEFRRIQDTDAMFVNGFMILPDRWICDECLPETAYEIAREMQAERDRKLGHGGSAKTVEI